MTGFGVPFGGMCSPIEAIVGYAVIVTIVDKKIRLKEARDLTFLSENTPILSSLEKIQIDGLIKYICHQNKISLDEDDIVPDEIIRAWLKHFHACLEEQYYEHVYVVVSECAACDKCIVDIEIKVLNEIAKQLKIDDQQKYIDVAKIRYTSLDNRATPDANETNVSTSQRFKPAEAVVAMMTVMAMCDYKFSRQERETIRFCFKQLPFLSQNITLERADEVIKEIENEIYRNRSFYFAGSGEEIGRPFYVYSPSPLSGSDLANQDAIAKDRRFYNKLVRQLSKCVSSSYKEQTYQAMCEIAASDEKFVGLEKEILDKLGDDFKIDPIRADNMLKIAKLRYFILEKNNATKRV